MNYNDKHSFYAEKYNRCMEEKNKNELWNSCKITIDGKKIDAKINLLTKEVYDLNNNLLRRY